MTNRLRLSDPARRVVTATALAMALAALGVGLAGCGGGGGDAGSSALTAATVSNVSVDRTSFGLLSTFTVTGTRLDSAATFSITGCNGVAFVAGGSATQQKLTCTPTNAMNVVMNVNSGNALVYTVSYTVPRPRVSLATTRGTIVLELNPAAAPLTVENFLRYVADGFYNGTIFHRVVPNFVVQGGGFTGVSGSTLTPQTGLRAAIPLETNRGLSNLRGTIAMARTDTADSATSQFYVNTIDNTFLDYISAAQPGYAVFGTVVSGLDAVDTIDSLPTRTVGPYDNVPVTNVVLQTAVRTQ